MFPRATTCAFFFFPTLFILSQIFFSINLVLLQRTQEDESNNTFFDIADLHILQAMGSKREMRKFIMYEPCNIIRVSDTSWNIITRYYTFSFYILIIVFSCFIMNLNYKSSKPFFLVGDPCLLYKYYPQDCVHSSYYVVW